MATLAQVAHFRGYFVQFSDETEYPNELVAQDIDYSLTFIDKATWGIRYDLGWVFLTAHYLYLSKRVAEGDIAPTTGSIQEFEAGRVKAKFNSGTKIYDEADDALLLQTAYGARYISMRNALIITVYV